MSDMPLPLRCKCRRKAVTSLRCARCSVPICPDCSIIAPAGMLCRECASSRRSPLFQVSLGSLTIAYLVCLLAASAGGWLFFSIGVSLGFFGLLLAYLYGLGVAEVALRVTGRKRGTSMEVLAGVCAAAGMIVGMVVTIASRSSMIYSNPMIYHAYLRSFWLNPWLYVELVIGVIGAVNRIRYI